MEATVDSLTPDSAVTSAFDMPPATVNRQAASDRHRGVSLSLSLLLSDREARTASSKDALLIALTGTGAAWFTSRYAPSRWWPSTQAHASPTHMIVIGSSASCCAPRGPTLIALASDWTCSALSSCVIRRC